jgi:hypothetical protein
MDVLEALRIVLDICGVLFLWVVAIILNFVRNVIAEID